MNQKTSYRVLAAALIVVLFAGLAVVVNVHADEIFPQSVGTAFSYQGKLYDGGSPANGNFDFKFTLFDSEVGGSAVAVQIEKADVDVHEGVFTVMLDFGANKFDGSPRWLEVGVRLGTSTGSYTTLVPRQSVSPTPYAIFADHVNWSGILNLPASFHFTEMALPSTVIQQGDIYKNSQIIAWAKVQKEGMLAIDGFNYGIDHIDHVSTGRYEVVLDVTVPDGGFIVPVVSPEVDWDSITNPPGPADLRIAVVDQIGPVHANSNKFGVYMFDGAGALVDNDFTVIVTGGGVANW